MVEIEDWKSELETKTVSKMGNLSINSKTITMLSGQSMAGKTATCIHFVDYAIKRKRKVLYVDTDKKSIIKRPDPNLFKEFYNKNKEMYDKYFMYTRSNQLDGLLEMDVHPNLLVIDSIYNAFIDIINPKERAMKIKKFMVELRDYIWKNDIAVIITTPIGRVVSNNEGTMVALGGEGLKYLSDVKVYIHFAKDEDSDKVSGDRRFFVVDRQHRYAFIIEEGGKIKEIK